MDSHTSSETGLPRASCRSCVSCAEGGRAGTWGESWFMHQKIPRPQRSCGARAHRPKHRRRWNPRPVSSEPTPSRLRETETRRAAGTGRDKQIVDLELNHHSCRHHSLTCASSSHFAAFDHQARLARMGREVFHSSDLRRSSPAWTSGAACHLTPLALPSSPSPSPMCL
jgi:hypothetical protein